MTGDSPGKTSRATHKIRTLGNPPIKRKSYRISYAYWEKVLEELDEMEMDGIIEKLESNWASPLVVLPINDKKVGLCIYYRTPILCQE